MSYLWILILLCNLKLVAAGSVGVILTAREDWTPSVKPSHEGNDDEPGISIRTKGRQDDETLDSCQPSQADWIKRYVEQQEEV